jgi:hypothetical protein
MDYQIRKEFLRWKRKHVSLRGLTNPPDVENGGMARFGQGIYSAALSYKSLARKYGKVFFVVNARPLKPRKFKTCNDLEIYLQSIPYDDIPKFCIEHGYDGWEVTGREYIRFNPDGKGSMVENVLYFQNEEALYNYWLTNV